MRYISSPAYQEVESSTVRALAAILRSTLKPNIEYFCFFDEIEAICPNSRIAALVLSDCGFAPNPNPATWGQALPGALKDDEVDPGEFDSDDPTTLASRFRWMASKLDPAGLIQQ